MTIHGKAHKFGDHVDTDVIIPATYLVTTDAKELAAHCMEGIDPDFPARVRQGDIIVAGENFGCGSSREHAPVAIKGAGISCVVAASFARIFFRNAINIGLALVTSPQAAREVKDGDELDVDLATGVISNLTRSAKYQGEPFPEFVREIIEAGGLVEYTRRRLSSGKSV
jgi:3-isopropylmalate/(R)-2-methylmalate dehydratase small subunit